MKTSKKGNTNSKKDNFGGKRKINIVGVPSLPNSLSFFLLWTVQVGSAAGNDRNVSYTAFLYLPFHSTARFSVFHVSSIV